MRVYSRWAISAMRRLQAALLREGAVTELDLVNLAEEIDSLGISQRHALSSHLRTILLHLLKWPYQPQKRQTGRSWQSSITRARDEFLGLQGSPWSLRPPCRRRGSLFRGEVG